MTQQSYNDTGCIVCKNYKNRVSGEGFECVFDQFDSGPGDLDDREMVCFCNTNQCNQCDYKDGTGCRNITFNFTKPTEMEICDDREICMLDIGSNTATKADRITTNLGNQNKSESDMVTNMTTESARNSFNPSNLISLIQGTLLPLANRNIMIETQLHA